MITVTGLAYQVVITDSNVMSNPRWLAKPTPPMCDCSQNIEAYFLHQAEINIDLQNKVHFLH